MAPKNKKQPAAPRETQVDKGYSGSADHQTGQVQSDPSQATPERLREDRLRQRGSDIETGENEE
jgi:hypothetical protein